jgi:hypothetical protein
MAPLTLLAAVPVLALALPIPFAAVHVLALPTLLLSMPAGVSTTVRESLFHRGFLHNVCTREGWARVRVRGVKVLRFKGLGFRGFLSL